MAPKHRTRPAAWKASVGKKYGLAIAHREAATGVVTSVKCRFCEIFGKEEGDAGSGRKRKRSKNNKYFVPPFRVDNIGRHLASQHPIKYSEYEKLSEAEKLAFFDDTIPVSNTLGAHFEGEHFLKFEIQCDIVEVLIGDLLFDPEEEDAIQTRDRALRLFTLEEEGSDDGPEDEGEDEDESAKRYTVVIKCSRLFWLVVGFVARGATFRAAADYALHVRNVTNMSVFVGGNDTRVAHFVRVVCASNLQKISDRLQVAWAFGLALDVGSHDGTSYLDIRVRFEDGGLIRNLHIMAIPLFEGKTAPVLFAAATKLLNTLAPKWKNSLIGLSTDGEPTMTGRITGVATQFTGATNLFCSRFWCALHQMDLVVQDEYQRLSDDKFVDTLTTMVSYLRRQYNLISTMKCTCPKFMSTRWMAMKRLTKFLKSVRIVICEYFEEKSSPCAPDAAWWVGLISLDAVATEISTVVERLQGKKTLVQEQEKEISFLLGTLSALGNVQGPKTSTEIESVDLSTSVVRGSYTSRAADARAFMEDQGSFVIASLAEMDTVEVDAISKSIASLFCGLVDGLSLVVAERDGDNNATDDNIGPCLPLDLCSTRASAFSAVVSRQKERLLRAKWTEGSIALIEDEHRELLRAYRDEPAFREVLDRRGVSTAVYDDLWADCRVRFPQLQEFCGGLAAVFPNTATVEADFSIINYEKDEYRKSLTDFSLEGILHTKQFDEVRNM